MRTAIVLAVLGLSACKKEAPAPAPQQTESVPISRDPRDAAAQLSAAQRAAAAAGRNNALHEESAKALEKAAQ
jgi:hypothetical protein